MSQTIKMYCTSWCPDCARARRFFRLRGLEFDEVDIDKVSGAEEEMRSKNGGSGKVPTILFGGGVLVEPSHWQLEEAFPEEDA